MIDVNLEMPDIDSKTENTLKHKNGYVLKKYKRESNIYDLHNYKYTFFLEKVQMCFEALKKTLLLFETIVKSFGDEYDL